MSLINKIPRGLRVLIIIAILAVLVWRFGFNTDYFYYSIGCAALIAIGFIVAIYFFKGKSEDKSENLKRSLKSGNSKQLTEDAANPEGGEMAAELISDGEETEKMTSKPSAMEVADRYRQMAAELENRETQSDAWKPIPKPEPDAELTLQTTEAEVEEASAPIAATDEAQLPVPLIEDESSLTEEDKNKLLNAVWYRCENPFCKNTNFLTVHHIIDEKDGGTNNLDNLIVMCPYCHELVHKNEIPEKELRNWISNRETRFKSQPEWHYK